MLRFPEGNRPAIVVQQPEQIELAGQGRSFPLAAVYPRRMLAGFTVLVHPEVLQHEKEAAATLAELESQLQQVQRVIPREPLARLQKLRIWIEWEKKKKGAAEFHVSAQWLKKNGYNPDKVGAMEINNARNFLAWSQRDQPWMVLHELAHGYHYLVLGVDHPDIRAAYKQAKERKLYQDVAYIRGGTRKAYALTNPQEYFAELSEAYFGKNDFFPFTRAELARHDPVGFQVLDKVWNQKNGGH